MTGFILLGVTSNATPNRRARWGGCDDRGIGSGACCGQRSHGRSCSRPGGIDRPAGRNGMRFLALAGEDRLRRATR